VTTNNQSGTPTVPVPGIRRLRYEPALDGIRGVGAILVFIVHLGMVVPDTPSMATIVPGAYVFMDVFFVVSGFLITGLLLGEQAKAGRLHVPRFYKRRALRLLPALWAMLICHVIWAGIVGYPVVGGWNVERDSLLLAAIHGLNFRLDTVLAPVALGLPHLWSLAIEEQFYIVWPFVVMLLLPVSRSLQRTVAYLLGGIVLIGWHRYQLVSDGANWMRLYTHTDTRADWLLVGALAAYLWAHRKIPLTLIKPAGWAGAAFIALYTWKGRQDLSFNSKGGVHPHCDRRRVCRACRDGIRLESEAPADLRTAPPAWPGLLQRLPLARTGHGGSSAQRAPMVIGDAGGGQRRDHGRCGLPVVHSDRAAILANRPSSPPHPRVDHGHGGPPHPLDLLFTSGAGGDPSRWVESSRDFAELERAGCGGLWFTDHLFCDRETPDCLMMAAIAASHTDSCRVGVGVLQLPLRRSAPSRKRRRRSR